MTLFKIVIFAFSCLLFFNMVRVILGLITVQFLPCCECLGLKKPHTSSATSTFRLNHSLSLSRLGSTLHFNASSCPAGSAMTLSNISNRVPLHDNCPTLFIIGARKGGTTSLYQYISKHPNFNGILLDAGARAGETFYFSKKYDRMTWDEYVGQFPNRTVAMTGESSVDNLVHCEAPKRIFESCGNTPKIVVLLRHPHHRFESNFFMRVEFRASALNEGTSIGVVIKQMVEKLTKKMKSRKFDIQNLQNDWAKLSCLFEPAGNMVYEGLYYIHLQNWLCNFPSENILILNSEEFFRYPCRIVQQTLEFLSLSPLEKKVCETVTATVYNKRRERTPLPHQVMSPEERQKLTDLYGPFSQKLFELLDWKSVDWN